MARPRTVRESLPGLWQLARYFWPQIRQYRLLLASSFFTLFAEVFLRLLEPWPLKFVFDRLVPTQAPNSLLPGQGYLEGMDTPRLLIVSAVILVVLGALRAMAAYHNVVGFAMIGNRVLTKLRARLYRHVQYLSLSFHSRARTGDLVLRVVQDVGLLQDVAVRAFLPLFGKLLLLAAMIGLMFFLNWRLALVSLSVLPLFWLRTIRLSRRIQDVARKQRQQQGIMAATAAESIQGIRTVQAMSLEGTFAKVFSAENEKILKEEIRAKRLSAQLERSVDVLVAVATALVLWYGGGLVLRAQISAGDLIIFLAYLKYAYRPVQDFAKYAGRLAKASAASHRVMELLDRVPDVRDRPDAVPAPAFAGAVCFDRVTFAYEHGPWLFENLTLRVEPGQHVALVGPSGGGKSTLLSLVLRLYDPHAGRLLIDGRDLREFTLESLRAQMSVVLQDNLLFAATVLDNIACGVAHATREDVEAAARLANAHDFIIQLPEGYETLLGERGVTLSHGQRQRLAVARAAVRRAPILILDEPTTGLDQDNQQAVLAGLRRLYENRTTFLITHDPNQARDADLILYLQDGQVMESGTHAELVRAGRYYAALFNGSQPPGKPEHVVSR
jgi:ATP-binding cassette, subfamily B, bacterial